VRVRREAAGASISILPVVGKVAHYQPPPKELSAWLDAVLAGKHPAPIGDPQKAAVAKMFAKCAAALPKALAAAMPAAKAERIVKAGEIFELAVPAPASFERSKKEDKADAADKPITQVRIEHTNWPIRVRCDARRTAQPMTDVLGAEETQTIRRGVLYQVYHAGPLAVGGRGWQVKVGSITYPDRRRGWVSTLFLQAVAPMGANPKEWLEVTVMDETHQPGATELAGVLKTVLAGIGATPVKAAPGKRE
jgi:hypothetical protein